MPIRPYTLDATGFDVPTQAEPMPPEVDPTPSPYAFAGPAVAAVADTIAAVPSVAAAAMRQENDVYNAIKMITEPDWGYDPNFNLEANLKEGGLWDEYRWNFVGVSTPGEYLYRLRKIEQEKKDKELLQSSGIGGLVASMAMGVLSPTILLPFIGGTRGLIKGAAVGASWALAGGLAQEIPLQLNQELRTLEESGMSVGLSMVLGAGLGGAAGFAGKTIERLSTDMAPVQREGAIPISVEHPMIQDEIAAITEQIGKLAPDDARGLEPLVQQIAMRERRLRDIEDELAKTKAADELDGAIEGSALGRAAGGGADIRDLDAGGLKNMLGVGERLTKLAGPVTAVLGQKLSTVGRRMMASLSTAGLRLEGNMILNSKGEIAGMVPSGRTTEGDFGMAEGVINARKGELLTLKEQAYSNYSDYFTGQTKERGSLANSKISAGAYFGGAKKAGKLKRDEFFSEVSIAMWKGGVHEIPEIAKTAQEFTAYMDSTLKEAQDLGLISKEIKDVTGDLGFMTRVFNIPAIKRNPLKFLDTLTNHFQDALGKDADKLRTGFSKRDAKDALKLEDAYVPLAEAQKMREDFSNELKALNSMDDDDNAPLETLITGYRKEMSRLSSARTKLKASLEPLTKKADRAPVLAQIEKLSAERKIYDDEVKRLEQLGGPDLEARAARRAEIKARMRNLNRGRFMVEEKARKKFDQMNKLEEDNLEAMDRVVKAAQTALRNADKVGFNADSELRALHADVLRAEAAAGKLEDQIEALNEQAVKSATRKAGPEADVIDNADAKIIGKIWTKDAKLVEARSDIKDAGDELDQWMNENRVEGGLRDAHEIIQDTLTRAVRRVNEANTNRAKRMAKLEAESKFDEKGWQAHIDEIKARRAARKQATHDKLEGLGDKNFNDLTGSGNFKERGDEIAQLAMERITGANMRLPGYDMMQDARGTELIRTLSVPSLKLAEDDFLITDAEHLMETYQNTLIPDIEIVKRLGAFAPDGERNLQFRELNEEETQVKRNLLFKMREAAKEKGAKPFNQDEYERMNVKIGDEYRLIKENLNAVISRLRNQWGLPNNPDHWGNRAANVVLQTQAWRLLGGVLIAQASDVARPVMRYGMGRTFKTAFNLMFNDLNLFKWQLKDAQRAYVAVETKQAEISQTLAGVMATSQRKSKFEAGLTWSTSKLGILFGFAPWTDLMKTISAGTMNMKLMDSIDLAINKAGNGKDRQEAIGYLYSLGLSEDMQRNIWDEMNNGGAIQHQGTWVPQTDKWSNIDTVRAYRGALNREAGATVITPGVELPKMANANPTLRLLFHLKSFALASTSKTLMAGLQQRDMAVMNGVLISLALGYVSYYLRSVIAGGDAQARMENATWEQRVDEAINASGILGAIQIGQQIADDIPGLRNVSSLNGLSSMAQGRPNEQSLRSSGGGLIEDLGGPTAGLAFTLATVITGLERPTRSTVHKVRQLLPLQNYIFLRRLFDQVENATGDSFNLRGQRR